MSIIPGLFITLLFLGGVIFLALSLVRIFRFINNGTGNISTIQLGERLVSVFIFIFGQSKLFLDRIPGIFHFFIFYGFCVISAGTVEMLIQTFDRHFSFDFLGPFYILLQFCQDILSFMVLVAVIYGLIRRFVLKIPRLKNFKAATTDATIVLLFIFFLMVTLIFSNSLKASDSLKASFFMPVSFIGGNIISFLNPNLETKIILLLINQWLHLLLIIGFMFYLPFSKHIHLIMVFPNVFFRKLEPRGMLSKLNLEDENAESFGVSKINDFSKKQLMDAFTCVECGRCQEFCPTTLTEKDLNPKFLIAKLKDQCYDKMKKRADQPKLIGDSITTDEIWDCTTCYACSEACPLIIEHPDKIVDMRRYLTLTESNFPQEAQNVFKNFENNSNPWGVGASTRASYLKELKVKKFSETENFEYLLYLGCAVSIDERNIKVGRALIEILNKAGMSFGVLGEEETCCGETVRRMGNEYLHTILVTQLIETFNKYKIKKIITSCPHCFNTLKNEYQQYGIKLEVYHHTEVLLKLLSERKLVLNKEKLKERDFVYHDSCYLGRYNNIYTAPRKILKDYLQLNLSEAERNKGKSLCCGAGGGRMWLEEKKGARINKVRTDELAKTNCRDFATACPYCLTMIKDGISETGKAETHKVRDICEILSEAL